MNSLSANQFIDTEEQVRERLVKEIMWFENRKRLREILQKNNLRILDWIIAKQKGIPRKGELKSDKVLFLVEKLSPENQTNGSIERFREKVNSAATKTYFRQEYTNDKMYKIVANL
jgi:hypothetical protein